MYPVVAPLGTSAVMSDADCTLNLAGVPLNVTLVVLVNEVPKIQTSAPTFAAAGDAVTNGSSPSDSRKTVPQPWVVRVSHGPVPP